MPPIRSVSSSAVEFYNRALDHYFLSTNPVEIDNLDTGATVGWERTGLRFLVYDNPAPGTSPVCRFYRAPAYGDSHFYSASPQECAATAAAHPVDWIYESPNVFYVQLPDTATGACPAGTAARLPVLQRAATTNHRYTAEIVVRDELAANAGLDRGRLRTGTLLSGHVRCSAVTACGALPRKALETVVGRRRRARRQRTSRRPR